MKSNLVIIKSYCRSSLQMKSFNSLLNSFANEDLHIDYLQSKIDSNQDRVNDIKDQINEENQYLGGLKNKLADASIELSESRQDLTDYKRNLKSNTLMNTELRKLFAELKKACKTVNQRKSYNKLIKSFSDANLTSEQKGFNKKGHDTFTNMKISSSKLKEGIKLLDKLEEDIRNCQKSGKEVDWAKLNPYFILTTNGFTQEEAEEVVHVF